MKVADNVGHAPRRLSTATALSYMRCAAAAAAAFQVRTNISGRPRPASACTVLRAGRPSSSSSSYRSLCCAEAVRWSAKRRRSRTTPADIDQTSTFSVRSRGSATRHSGTSCELRHNGLHAVHQTVMANLIEIYVICQHL